MLVLNRVESHGRGSGVPMIAQSASIWTVRDGRLAHHRLLSGDRADRDEALAALRGRSNPRTA